MRVLLLCLFTLAGSAASAQSAYVPFRPLAVGDEWTHLVSTAYIADSWSCPTETPVLYLRTEVLSETTLGGADARIVACTTYSTSGVQTAFGTLAVPLAFGAATVLTGNGDACNAVLTGSAPAPRWDLPNPVQIGGTAYLMGDVAHRVSVFPRGYSERRYGDLVGLTLTAEQQTGSAANMWCSSTVRALTYARVGGVEYGTRPVAGEGAPAAAATLRAYPNPARAALTVDADGAVRVFDALGRLVATGTAAPTRPLRLDVSAWPAGIYVARTDAGQAVRLVVAR